MILNVSSRTDIVHYYTPWFLERLREGRAIVPNPEVPDHAMELDLSPESVQGIVFCSKDYRPLFFSYVLFSFTLSCRISRDSPGNGPSTATTPSRPTAGMWSPGCRT